MALNILTLDVDESETVNAHVDDNFGYNHGGQVTLDHNRTLGITQLAISCDEDNEGYLWVTMNIEHVRKLYAALERIIRDS